MGIAKLIPHKENISSSYDVYGEVRANQDDVEFSFKALGPFKKGKKSFSSIPYKNWGLWEEDVVELFIRGEGAESYLEVQVGVSGASFQLIIEKPRVLYYTPIFNTIKATSSLNKDEFKGSIFIPKDMIPGDTKKLYGGMYAILGNPREYYALNPNPEDKPDFHRPERFVLL